MKKTKSKKFLSLFVVSVLMLGSVGVLAQENLDVVVDGGNVIERNYASLVVVLNSLIGGITGNIEETTRSEVRLAGVPVLVDESITQIDAFEILAFPTTSVIDFNTIVTGVLFEQTEPNTNVNGVISQWSTNEITSSVGEIGLNDQPLRSVGEEFLASGSNLEITDFDNGGSNRFDYLLEGTPNSVNGILCTGGVSVCPSVTQLSTFFGLSVVERYHAEAIVTGTDQLIAVSEDGTIWNFLYREDQTQDWDFIFGQTIVNGFGVSSGGTTETLILLPSDVGAFDLYAII